MDWNEKKEIVEKLKRNERALCFLSEEEKEVLNTVGNGNVRRLIGCYIDGVAKWDTLCHGAVVTLCGSLRIYRIKEEYQLPLEAPKGYRIVSKEERELNDYPRNIVVTFIEASLNSIWDQSVTATGWADGWRERYIFAVPEDFHFDSVKVEANGKTVWISKESAEALGLK